MNNQIETGGKGPDTCYFCGKNLPVIGSAFSKVIYKVLKVTSYYPRRVEYDVKVIALPRCKRCENLHSHQKWIPWVVAIPIALGGLVLAVNLETPFIATGLIGLLYGFLIGRLVIRLVMRIAGVKSTLNSGIKRHPLLTDYLQQKWRLSKPRGV